MDPFQTPTAAERFTMTLDGLCRAVAARIAGGAMAAAMILVVWTRIRRAEQRIQALLVRFRARGFQALPVHLRVGMRQGTTTRRRAGSTVRLPKLPKVKLPRGFGWLCPLVPCQAANYGSQLRAVLGDPEMVALLKASPQARRILAPICRMLAVEPEVLQRPAANEPPELAGNDGSGATVGCEVSSELAPAPHRPSAMRATSRPFSTGPPD